MGFAKYGLKCKHGDTEITKDGHTMMWEDVVRDLNRKSFLEEKFSIDNKAMFQLPSIDRFQAEVMFRCALDRQTADYIYNWFKRQQKHS